MSRMAQRLADGEVGVGTLMLTHGDELIELLGYVGLDFVCVDMMVTPLDWSEVAAMVRAAGTYGMSPWVRLPAYPWGDEEIDPSLPASVLKALALGAECVLASVNGAEQVRRLLHPLANAHRRFYIRRGGPDRTEAQRAFDAAEPEQHVVPIIESLGALRQIDEILAVDGLRMIYLGMGDLSRQLGPGDDQDASVRQVVRDVAAKAAARGVIVCANTLPYNATDDLPGAVNDGVEALWRCGVRLVLTPRPTMLLQHVYEKMLGALRPRMRGVGAMTDTIVPSTSSAPVDALEAKYGTDLTANPPTMTADAYADTLALRDRLDQHFAKISLGFTSGVVRRTVLDARTRLLVQIGQFTVSKSHDHLERALRVALDGVVPPRDAIESVFQCLIYGGDTVLDPALRVFARVAGELGVLDRLAEGQLPLAGTAGTRDFDAERATWPAPVAADPTTDEMVERYGWHGVSTGIRYRGQHHVAILRHFDSMDRDFARLWEDFAYGGMYSRWVLDDRTRILCTVGDLLALGAATSAKEHMRSGLAAGATPRDLLEIVFLTGAYFGFPLMTASLRAVEEVLTSEGRLDEIGSPPAHPYDAKK